MRLALHNDPQRGIPRKRIALTFDGPVEIGKWYWVPSAPIGPRHQLHLPIVDNLHTDEGLDRPHYNLDARFLTKRMHADLFLPNRQRVAGQDVKITLHVFQCLREQPQKPLYYGNELYKIFESACDDGRRMVGLKCPHKGTDLSTCPVVDGVVTCPAHGLRWRVANGDLVKEPSLCREGEA